MPLALGQGAKELDGEGEVVAGTALMPHATDDAVDEDDRVVSRLAAGERAVRGSAGEQPEPRLGCHNEPIEVREQARYAGTLDRGGGVPVNVPELLTLDA